MYASGTDMVDSGMLIVLLGEQHSQTPSPCLLYLELYLIKGKIAY